MGTEEVLDLAIQIADALGAAHEKGQFGRSWLSVSPDEEWILWILYSETPRWTSELMLVENFR
jgi:hypothetical protein